MDHSKLSRAELIGAIASIILLASLLLLSWYDLGQTEARMKGEEAAFICGINEYSCTGFETFPILRWLLIAGAAAPLILAYIVVRGHKLSWAPGEMTMVVGFTAFVLIGYNGLLDKPGAVGAEIGVSLQIGYLVALLASVGIAASGALRMMDSQKGAVRRAPGTV